MIRLFLFTFLFLLSFVASFAQNSLDRSILWRIDGNGLERPSYLLGTFHLVCVEDLILSEKVVRTMEEVGQIALEIDLTNMDEMMRVQELMVSSETLSSQLGEDDREEFRQLLNVKYGIDLAEVDYYPPMVLMGLLAMKSVSCEVKGYDMEVLLAGVRLEKKFLGLECFSDQMALMNELYTAEVLLEQLKEEEDEASMYREMLDLFLAEDIQALYTMVADSFDVRAEGKKKLLDQRNQHWVGKMQTMMTEESTLFAVGAGHLAGELGVIALLKQAGYVVQPILK